MQDGDDIKGRDVSTHPQGILVRGKVYQVVPVVKGDTLTTVGCARCAFYLPGVWCRLSEAAENKLFQLAENCTTVNNGAAYWELVPDAAGAFGRTGEEIHDITRGLCR